MPHRMPRFGSAFSAFSGVSALALAATLASTPALAAGPNYQPFDAQVAAGEVVVPIDAATNPHQCVIVPVPGMLHFNGIINGKGNSSHLGKVSLAATDCINGVLALFVFNKGKLTLTAANGDTLTADYQGTIVPTATPPVYDAIGTYVVTGGTGRFARASGFGALTGSLDLVTGESSYRMNGKIAY